MVCDAEDLLSALMTEYYIAEALEKVDKQYGFNTFENFGWAVFSIISEWIKLNEEK
jgi:hypothetical protein